jgi:hypothetical protein
MIAATAVALCIPAFAAAEDWRGLNIHVEG